MVHNKTKRFLNNVASTYIHNCNNIDDQKNVLTSICNVKESQRPTSMTMTTWIEDYDFVPISQDEMTKFNLLVNTTNVTLRKIIN